MEAVALHDYTAENDKELSIEKGCRLTILNPDHSGDWYMGDTGEQNGLVPRNYVQLLPYSWYKGKVPSSTVKLHLLSQPTDGAFIVHDSESCLGDLEISAKFGDNVLSYRILRDTSGRYFLWTVKFDSVNDLVEYHRKASISRDFDNLFLKDCVETFVKAQWDFTAEEDEEMSFSKGDIIEVIGKNDNDNWWLGRVAGKPNGKIPANYTVPLEQNS